MFIFGNWKMSQALEEAETFVQSWDFSGEVEAAVFPSHPHLQSVKTYAEQRKIPLEVGAQDCSTQEKGAFTGQVAAAMVDELALKYILLGHSECRQAGDDEESLKAKLEQVEKTRLTPVFCIGEHLDQRENGELETVLKTQMATVREFSRDFVVAYEPVWAIGTGRVAKPQEITAVHQFISEQLQGSKLKGILYGGSAKPENAAEILGLPGVNGLLVGGASLHYESFKKILEIAAETKESKRDG